ncbi:hypothetical protein [Ancylobacter oerskovii]|uniref:DUF4352 domain-containing protein n=1 Tax=Ancylobacter oerskovii TaxID=459519 RepID=A0ABW4YYU8_9HYPH|nr:hypothetical protein [Ancylobacter oerskovii]MBS7543999.1 hypothetical protein [Ancylobacter oerskovii]
MNHLASLVAVVLGGGMLGTMMNTLPGYDRSFQPFSVRADDSNFGQGRLFTAELGGLRSAEAISYTQYGKDVVRRTSATFLVVELAISAREESRQMEAIWLGATGRQYSQSARLENAPRTLSSVVFQPGLTDKALAMFELPEDEIVGGRLVLMARGNAVMDSAVYFVPPATAPEKQALLRVEP